MPDRVGKGNGGGTRIRISREGTVWPYDPDADELIRIELERQIQVEKSTSTSWIVPPKRLNKENAHQSELRILAEYARSYRTQKSVRPLSNINGYVFAAVKQAGGVIEWINSSDIRLKRFWTIVEAQNKHAVVPSDK